jgi:predicted ArsR family transcriptional regulator
MTADELSEILGMTAVGVRAHLTLLERDGVVSCAPMRRRIGRPAHLYRLTEQADDLFPKNYDQLAVTLLEDLRESYGEGAVRTLLARRTERLKEAYRERLSGKPLREQLAELVRILDEAGYMARLEQREDGSFELSEDNCAIARVARRFPATCLFELNLFDDLLGPNVAIARQAHMVKGDIRCSYVIRERKENQQNRE